MALTACSLRAVAMVSVALVAMPGSKSVAADQEPVRVLAHEDLHPVHAAALDDSVAVVLSGIEPLIHVFHPTGHSSWGKRGHGPAELQTPTQLALRNDTVFVLDRVPGATAISMFDLEGRHLGRVPVRGAGIVARFDVRGQDFVLETREFGASDRWLIRIRRSGVGVDTLARLMTPRLIRIDAAGGPGYSVYPPFQPVGRWAVSAADEILLWNAPRGELDVLTDSAGPALRRPLTIQGTMVVREIDREEWFADQIPSGLQGQGTDPLRFARARAREVIEFPDTFPSVMDLRGDPEGGVWVQRSPRSSGEVWELVRSNTRCDHVTLPAGRRVLAFGSVFVAVRARDPETDLERVELFTRSQFVHCN